MDPPARVLLDPPGYPMPPWLIAVIVVVVIFGRAEWFRQEWRKIRRKKEGSDARGH